MNYQKVYMNQIYSSTLLGQLAHMWKNQLLCDAMIRTGQVTTKAHRVVLVAACPMLQSMENASSGSHLEVRLAADIKQDAVNTFLQYLYEGYMMLTEENCRDVEKVARLLQVDNVSKCCSDFYKCMQSKTGQNLGGSQYKYSGQDATDFKHVKATELQKTVHERMMKRTSEFNRPGSPGGKRPRFNRGGSPDVTVIGAEQADDTASMAHSYRSSAPDPWERVPHLGSGLSSKGASGKQQPGVVDIVEESLELVQTEPLDKDSHQTGSRPSDSRNPQKSSMSISVASHFNTDPEVNVVNVTGNKNQGSSSDLNTSTSAPTPSSRGSITVSPLTIFSDSPATSREVAGMTSSSSSSTSLRQEPQRQSEPVMYIQRASEHVTSTPQRQSFPTGSQSKPFAVGSAVQAGSSPASSETPPIGSPAANKSRGPSRQDASGQDDKGKDQRPKSADSQDMIPDLSIVKVESNILEDTGGLDMHVDMPEAGVMHMHTTRMSQGGEHEDASDNEMEDWTREEMSNEGSNVSGDQNNSWYMGTFKGSGNTMYLTPTEWKYEEPSDLVASSSKGDVSQTGSVLDMFPGHHFIRIPGCKRACAFCNIKRVKTKSGWAIKSYYKCVVCDVPLCRGKDKVCFEKYHELMSMDEHQGMSPKMMQKVVKASIKLKQQHATTGISYVDEVIEFTDS